MGTVESNAGNRPVSLHVEDTGGSGPTVVLIHGWPLSAESWAPQLPALTNAGFRVVSYDRRGFGRSDQPGDGYDYDTMAGDLKAVIDDLGLEDVALVGFSMGGGEVARYVGNYGTDGIRTAVFASAVPPYLLKTDDNPDGGLSNDDVEGMKEGLSSDRARFFEGFSENFYTADGDLVAEPEVVAEWRRLASRASTEAALDCIDAFSLTDFRQDLEKFDIPTLIIHGDSDAIVPFEVSGERTGTCQGVVAGFFSFSFGRLAC